MTAGAPIPGQLREPLVSELHGVGYSFENGELAYLAATRKIEDPIRDKVAWRLHRQLGHDTVVSREWPLGGGQSADIALLREATPWAVVEFKALYAFDVHVEKNRGEYLERVQADLARAAMWAPRAEAYAVVLTTHVAGTIRCAV